MSWAWCTPSVSAPEKSSVGGCKFQPVWDTLGLISKTETAKHRIRYVLGKWILNSNNIPDSRLILYIWRFSWHIILDWGLRLHRNITKHFCCTTEIVRESAHSDKRGNWRQVHTAYHNGHCWRRLPGSGMKSYLHHTLHICLSWPWSLTHDHSQLASKHNHHDS